MIKETVYKIDEYLDYPPGTTCIYCIHCIVNSKNYIGQTVDLRRRTGEHVKNSKNPSSNEYDFPIQCAIRKYGVENFELIVLEECLKSDLDRLEIKYIGIYKSMIYENGYNQTKGGQFYKNGRPTNTVLNQSIVYQIRELILHGYLFQEAFELFKESFPEIKTSRNTILNVWEGINWGDVHPDVYEISELDRFNLVFYHLFKIKFDEIFDLVILGKPKEEIYNKYCDTIPDTILVNIILGSIKKDYRCLSFAFGKSKNNSNKFNKKVKSIDFNGNSKIYKSVLSAGLLTGVDPATITKCCRPNYLNKTGNGYKFEYID